MLLRKDCRNCIQSIPHYVNNDQSNLLTGILKERLRHLLSNLCSIKEKKIIDYTHVT